MPRNIHIMSKAQRILTNMEKYKMVISIFVKEISISSSASDDLREDSVIGVCLERGRKISSSKNFKVSDIKKKISDSKSNDVIYPIEQKLQLIATLYKDPSTGLFQKKKGKLILRELQKNSIFGSAYVGLGVFKLQLDALANELLLLSPNSKMKTTEESFPMDLFKGVFKVKMTTSFIQNNFADDNMSIGSDDSDASSVSTTIGASFNYNIRNEYNNNNFLNKIGFNNVNNNNNDDDNDDDNNFDGDNNSPNNDKLSKVIKTKMMKAEADKETFELFQKEMSNKNQKIEDLENTIKSLKQQHHDDMIVVQTNLNTAEASLLRERNNNNNNNNNDNNNNNEEIVTLSSKYGKVSAELQLMNEDLKYYKLLADKSVLEKNEEMNSSHEAATAAVAANIKRAELQQENSEILDELIEIKMKHANLAIDYETEVRNNFSLRKKVQDYAEQVTKLEMKYIQALGMALPPGSTGSDGFLLSSPKDSSKVEDVFYIYPMKEPESLISSNNPSRSPSFSISNNNNNSNNNNIEAISRSSSFSIIVETAGPSVNPLVGSRRPTITTINNTIN